MNYVTFVSDFRNRPEHRSHAGFTERPRLRRGDSSATNAPERSPKKENRSLPAAGLKRYQQGSDKQDARPPRRLSHATPLPRFGQELIQPRRQRHQHRQPRVRCHPPQAEIAVPLQPAILLPPADTRSTLHRLAYIAFHATLPRRMRPPNSLMSSSGFSHASSSQAETARTVSRRAQPPSGQRYK